MIFDYDNEQPVMRKCFVFLTAAFFSFFERVVDVILRDCMYLGVPLVMVFVSTLSKMR